MTKVFLLILNWNGKEDTLECLKSVKKLNTRGLDLKILVIDNASEDDSVEAIGSANFGENVIVIENEKNLGFAGGNNVGINYALDNGADYVLIMNNDLTVDSQLLLQSIKSFRGQEKVGAVTPMIYFFKGFEFHRKRYRKNERGRVVWSAGGRIDWKNVYAQNFGVDEVDNGQFVEEETEFATGACVLYKASVLKRVGLFDEKYFLYLEDADLSIRMKKNGYKIWFDPEARAWHKVAQSSKIGSSLNDYFITRNRLLFGMKYAPWRSKTALFRESMRMITQGRKWQKIGVRDFYLRRFYKGSWKS